MDFHVENRPCHERILNFFRGVKILFKTTNFQFKENRLSYWNFQDREYESFNCKKCFLTWCYRNLFRENIRAVVWKNDKNSRKFFLCNSDRRPYTHNKLSFAFGFTEKWHKCPGLGLIAYKTNPYNLFKFM